MGSRHEPGLVAIVKPDQQPFEIGDEVDQLQPFSTFDGLLVAPAGTVLHQSISIQKHQRSLVASLGVDMSSPAFDRKLDDGTGVPAAGNGDIEMKMNVPIVA